MGEMNIFACQTDSLRLALGVGGGTAVPLSAPKVDASSHGEGSGFRRPANGREDSMKSSRRRGFCLERKRAL